MSRDWGAARAETWVRRTGYALAGAALLGVVAGCSGPTKRDATEACERVAVMRGEGSELVDVTTEHIRADSYKIEGTVTTPGLPDEAFTGFTSLEDGEYVCAIDL